MVEGLLHRGPGVWGTVVSEDDTGLPDTPDGGGFLAVVPADRLDNVLALAGADYPADQIAYIGFGLDRATVDAWGGVLVEVHGDGDFKVPLQGDALVCRLPEQHADYVRGCARVSLPERGEARASHGEGGFHFSVE